MLQRDIEYLLLASSVTVNVNSTVFPLMFVLYLEIMVNPLSLLVLKNGFGGIIADGVELLGANSWLTTVVEESVPVVVSVRM